MLWFGQTHAHKNCASELWVEGIHTYHVEGSLGCASSRGPDIYRLTVTERRLREKQLPGSYILPQRGFTATPARCWAALYGVGCLSVRAAQAVSLCVSRGPPLGMFVSCLACGAIIAAATANRRRLFRQNPYKTCISLVELGRASRDFLVHFEKIPTKKFPRYRRCAFFLGRVDIGVGSSLVSYLFERSEFLVDTQWGALYSAGNIVRVPAIVRVKSLGTTWTPP